MRCHLRDSWNCTLSLKQRSYWCTSVRYDSNPQSRSLREIRNHMQLYDSDIIFMLCSQVGYEKTNDGAKEKSSKATFPYTAHEKY
jgi:hypothetical protein